MKTLFAYDASACADAAIEDLLRAGFPRAVELTVLSTTEVWLPPPSILETLGQHLPERREREIEAAAALAGEASVRLRALFPHWQVVPRGDFGDPAAKILEEADRCKSDLIVVGSHGRTALGRMVLGSVSQKVATEAPCSVRVARGRPDRESGPIRLIIGMNGSPGSQAAIGEVARRAWPHGTAVALVTAFGPYATSDGEIGRGAHAIRDLHGRARETLEAAGLDVTSEISEGDPKRALVERARELDADCIFLGTRDLNAMGRFLLGSVSTAVVNRAHCSVEVVREREWNVA